MATDADYKLSKRNHALKVAHGINSEEYQELIDKQNGRCAICKTNVPKGGWHLDHDHDTGDRRGILCNPCNRGIGYLQDSRRILAFALEYLEKYK